MASSVRRLGGACFDGGRMWQSGARVNGGRKRFFSEKKLLVAWGCGVAVAMADRRCCGTGEDGLPRPLRGLAMMAIDGFWIAARCKARMAAFAVMTGGGVLRSRQIPQEKTFFASFFKKEARSCLTRKTGSPASAALSFHATSSPRTQSGKCRGVGVRGRLGRRIRPGRPGRCRT